MSLRQINLIKSCKKFYENFRSNNFHLYKDTPVYLASYSNSIGLKVLTSFENKNKLDINFITILKDIFYSLNYLNNKIIFSDNRYFYDKIIITWAYKNNFKKDGSLQDRYFNCNSQTLKNTLWFVVYLDNRRPNKLKKNIILFTPNKGRRYNILILIKKLFKYSPYIFKNFKYFLLLMSNHNFFSQIFLQRFKFFFNKKVKKIIMPYEGQPFQNKVIEYTKKKK